MLNNSLILFVAITPFIAWTLYREVRNRGVTAFFFSCFWLWFVYILSPFFLNLYPERIANSRFDISFLALDDALPLFFCAAGVFFFVLGSWASKKVVFFPTRKKYEIKPNDAQDVRYSFWLLCIGVVALVAFFYFYGGFSYVLSHLSLIRSGVDENKSYLGAFSKIFSVFILISFYVYLAWFLKRSDKRIGGILLLLLMFLICCFKLYVDAGRQVAIDFLAASFMVYYLSKGKIPVAYLTISLIFSFFYIIFGKIFIFSIYSGDFDATSFLDHRFNEVLQNSFYAFMSEFTHQYLSIVNFLAGSNDFRWFGDYFVWLAKPFKLIGWDIPDSISYYNTFIIHGVWDSEIPPGIVAFGLISLGLPGVIAHCFIVGFLISKFDMVYRNLDYKGPFFVGVYAACAISLSYLVSNADIALFVQGRIPHFVLLMGALFVYKVRREKVQVYGRKNRFAIS